MRKTYVLDTNVLLHDPQALFKFEDNDLIIPIYVIEEIDQFKREPTERGRNARAAARFLDLQRERGSLSHGVELEDGGTLRVHVPATRPELKSALRPSSGDHAILQTALDLRDSMPDRPTIFVTMDVNLRIRADALGLSTEAYENQSVDLDRQDTGIVELTVTGSELEAFFSNGTLPVAAERAPKPNASIVLKNGDAQSRSGLGRYRADRGAVTALNVPREGIMGIRPRNKEQSFALDLLLDDSVKVITILGKAGSGKTLLALAAGLERVAQHGAFSRLLVSRPIMPLGRDLGYLPGDVSEKLHPWMQPIFDNLEFLLVSGGGKRRGLRGFDELFSSGQLQVEALTYIRGRSLPQQFVIVDEAQNLTPHEVKTVITRCGEGTKIVLTGDAFQIDNPYVDSSSNGLSVAASRLSGQRLAGHIVLTKGERSELANIAAREL